MAEQYNLKGDGRPLVGASRPMIGAVPPTLNLQNLQTDLQDLQTAEVPIQLQNLESFEAEPTQYAQEYEIDSDEITFGTTEYALISMWAIFTAGVFGLLYKIT